MPSLADATDDTYVEVMAGIEDHVATLGFGGLLVGALAASAVATGLQLGDAPLAVQALTTAGSGLYVVVLGITRVVHLPLNARIVAGRHGQSAETATLRLLVERRWVRWHRVRTALAVASFASTVLATAAHGVGPGAS